MENYKELQYTIKLTSRKNSISVVFLHGYIQIKAPKKTSLKVINKFLENNYSIIMQRLEKINFTASQLNNGDYILIQGEQYNVNIIESEDEKIEIKNQEIYFFIKPENNKYLNKKHLLFKYLKEIAKLDIKRLVIKFSEVMQLYPNNVKINSAEKRWGSCNYITNTLNFSLRIAMLPEYVQEYIVIHELAHLEHPNHSKEFWQLVAKFMPDYKEAENYIKAKSHILI